MKKKGLVWYTRLLGGKGDKIYLNTEKAQEYLEKGYTLHCECNPTDL